MSPMMGDMRLSEMPIFASICLIILTCLKDCMLSSFWLLWLGECSDVANLSQLR